MSLSLSSCRCHSESVCCFVSQVHSFTHYVDLYSPSSRLLLRSAHHSSPVKKSNFKARSEGVLYPFLDSNPEHVLRKIHHCTFGRKIPGRPFLGFYPRKFDFISQKVLMTFFF